MFTMEFNLKGSKNIMENFQEGLNELLNKNYSEALRLFEEEKIDFVKEYQPYYEKCACPGLAFMYFYGVGVERNYKKAWEECHLISYHMHYDRMEESLDGSNWLTVFIAAKLLYNGLYVEKDITEALILFKKIADMYKIERTLNNDPLFKIVFDEYNDIDMQYVMGLIYFYKGKYFDSKNYEISKKFLEKIIKSDNHEGAKILLQEIKNQEK